jgi:hypothetical protein
VRYDLTGQVFGRLTAETYLPGSRNSRRAQWQCRCECGASTSVDTHGLRSGHTQSCGCLHQETVRITNKTHGRTQTIEYRSWAHAKERCMNPNAKSYARYGGRGITMCRRWRNSFEAFFADMGPKPSPKHSLDRINNDGPYSPKNCRWATQLQQARNTSQNAVYKINGKILCGTEAAEELGLNADTVKNRRNLGWSDAKIAATPLTVVKVRRFSFRGETLTLHKWAKRTGIAKATLYNRICRGWSIAKTLTEPIEPQGRW